MPLQWNPQSVNSLRFLLKKVFDFRWLFAFLPVVTEVMRDAAYPGDAWGLLGRSTTVVASRGA